MLIQETYKFVVNFDAAQDDAEPPAAHEIHPLCFMGRVDVHGKVAGKVDARGFGVADVRDVVNMSYTMSDQLN